MHFAREAYPIVLPFALVFVLAVVWGLFRCSQSWIYIGFIFGLIGFLLLLFFRDPVRRAPVGEGNVVSPADGKVLLSESLPDGRKHVAIFMSVFSVHINRTPVSGKVVRVDVTPGTYFNAATDTAAKGNARVEVEAVTNYGAVSWRQISGLIARKISCRLKPGDEFRIGDKFGLIYFGSRMEVFLPNEAELLAIPGQNVKAGESLIAKFTHENKK